LFLQLCNQQASHRREHFFDGARIEVRAGRGARRDFAAHMLVADQDIEDVISAFDGIRGGKCTRIGQGRTCGWICDERCNVGNAGAVEHASLNARLKFIGERVHGFSRLVIIYVKSLGNFIYQALPVGTLQACGNCHV
jgi:hypothetical protein